ncbi:PTS transporter subunit EIIC [Rosenbergiella australiborealis]|uniref:PTS transporter subunit EIIC n=1 Tax=Rosenbergiella australiborealis TaxID=1544696 RepID=UPI001F4EDD15|nr:PTS transporter subunit EIIC [Rosenbergiella australiborealis]
MSSRAEIGTVIDGLGGRENIKDYFHCATRLRFSLYDYSLIDQEKLKSQPSVLTVIIASGQCQLIIGNGVENVYQEVNKFIKNIDASKTIDNSSENEIDHTEATKESKINIVFGFISGSFLPIIGIISAAGLLRAVTTVLGGFSYFHGSETLKVITLIANVPFHYLPVILGFSIARKLKSNELVGAAIGAALLYPEFTKLAGQTLHFSGIPITIADYSGTVFPIFFAVITAAFLEKLLKRVVPNSLQLMIVPLAILVTVIPVTLIFLGPFGAILGEYMAKGILYVINLSGLLSGIFIGAFYSIIVMFGLHWALTPITFTNLAHGGDPIYAIGGMSAIAQMGIALGILIKSRDSKTRQLAGSAFFPALISGITEPILYGLIIPNKRTLPFMFISGAVGGGIIGFYGVKINEIIFASLLSIPSAQNILVYTVALFATLLTGALLVIIFGYESNSDVSGDKK